MAAPIGNQNARKAKIWEQALKRALARKSNKDVDAGLDLIAAQCVDAACNGEQWAIREIADRFDGRPAQAHEVTGADGGPLEILNMSDLEVGQRLLSVWDRAAGATETSQ